MVTVQQYDKDSTIVTIRWWQLDCDITMVTIQQDDNNNTTVRLGEYDGDNTIVTVRWLQFDSTMNYHHRGTSQ
jgi:hypothetical protein